MAFSTFFLVVNSPDGGREGGKRDFGAKDEESVTFRAKSDIQLGVQMEGCRIEAEGAC